MDKRIVTLSDGAKIYTESKLEVKINLLLYTFTAVPVMDAGIFDIWP